MRCRPVATAAALVLGLSAVTGATPGAAVAAPPDVRPVPPAPLTNLAHLDFLGATVVPPAQAGHTTYRLDADPSVGTLWVYATRQADGSYARVGGGTYDSASNTYGQGAYDADDVARAAVVYLRHWRRFGDAHSRVRAEALLRGLTYMQTATGPDAGNVVLWMQPDGTLHPSPTPADVPDPSDSANSYWLARTVWALGEGYAAFAGADPRFAGFLAARLQLAVGALDRDSLARVGHFLPVDGARTPAWLVAGGADASAEAVLGLAAYVQAGGSGRARTALAQLAAGVADQGDPAGAAPGAGWPYGAVLPSATSRSSWHAWASFAPAALARAARALGDPDLLAPAVADTAGFTPALIAAYGPVDGLTPAPTDRSEIAYGADSRVEALLATAAATGSTGLRELAGVTAGWFFGQNPAGVPLYDPATGVGFDGVSADGVVNRNSGAESTIHALLAMLALDAAPDVARIARASGAVSARDSTTVVEAESATTTGAARARPADPPASAESAWSGGAGLHVTGPATATWTVPAASRPRVLEAVVDRVPGRAGTASFAARGGDGGGGGGRAVGPVGSVSFGGGGAQGESAVPGELVPVVVGVVPAGATGLTATFRGGPADLDALLLTPQVSTLRAGSTALLVSRADHPTPDRLDVGPRPVLAAAYDRHGRTVARTAGAGTLTLTVPPGGFVTVIPVEVAQGR